MSEAISDETREMLRAAVAAFNRRDERAWLAFFGPDVEFYDQLTLNPNQYRGHDGAATWFRSWEKVWEDFSISDLEVLREQGDVVLFRFVARGRGRGSGIEVAQDFWTVGTLRNGRFIRIENHTTEAAALAAGGLLE